MSLNFPKKIFVASAGDIPEVRKFIIEYFNIRNSHIKSATKIDVFEVYAWEISKDPKYHNNPQEYQDDLIKKTNDEVDIFVLITGKKLGNFMQQEFEWFVNNLLPKGCAFYYVAMPTVSSIDGIDRHNSLVKWENKKVGSSSWLGSLKKTTDTYDELRNNLDRQIIIHELRFAQTIKII